MEPTSKKLGSSQDRDPLAAQGRFLPRRIGYTFAVTSLLIAVLSAFTASPSQATSNFTNKTTADGLGGNVVLGVFAGVALFTPRPTVDSPSLPTAGQPSPTRPQLTASATSPSSGSMPRGRPSMPPPTADCPPPPTAGQPSPTRPPPTASAGTPCSGSMPSGRLSMPRQTVDSPSPPGADHRERGSPCHKSRRQ